MLPPQTLSSSGDALSAQVIHLGAQVSKLSPTISHPVSQTIPHQIPSPLLTKSLSLLCTFLNSCPFHCSTFCILLSELLPCPPPSTSYPPVRTSCHLLVYLGCRMKCHRLGDLSNRNIFLTVIETGSPRSRCLYSWLANGYLLTVWPLLIPHMASSLHGLRERKISVASSSSYKDSSPIT